MIEHKIINADTLETNLFQTFGNVDIIYTDPPWNDYWVNRFTKGKHKSFLEMIEKFITQLQDFSSILYIEMGKSNIDNFLRIMKVRGAITLNLWTLPYKKSYSFLWRGYFKGQYIKFPVELPKLRGDNKFIELLKQEQNHSTILDPFIGVDGRTLFMAEKLGAKCYGVEFSLLKIEKLKAKYEKITGSQLR